MNDNSLYSGYFPDVGPYGDMFTPMRFLWVGRAGTRSTLSRIIFDNGWAVVLFGHELDLYYTSIFLWEMLHVIKDFLWRMLVKKFLIIATGSQEFSVENASRGFCMENASLVNDFL